MCGGGAGRPVGAGEGEWGANLSSLLMAIFYMSSYFGTSVMIENSVMKIFTGVAHL